MRSRFFPLLTLAIILVAKIPAASAGTIVNLNATSASTASQTLALGPGTYTVTIIGTSTAGALYNGWNSSAGASTNNLWTDRYGFQFGSGDQLGFTIANNTGYATAVAALAAYSAATTLQAYDYTTASPSGFYPNAYSFTLNTTTNFTLSIPDYGSYGDDSGGESLLVSQVGAAPEPGTTSLLAGGLLMAAGLKFRSRRKELAKPQR